MRKIALVDVDGHNFPNLALMKLSSHHKQQGDSVEWVNNFSRYDIAYKAKVFSFSPEDDTIIMADQIIQGGTGYNLTSALSETVEHCFPDYSLYPQYKCAVGFLTRGCSRGCPFCIVKDKEGSSHKVSKLSEFWNGQKEIQLLDPNILEYVLGSGDVAIFDQLIKSGAWVEFNQGLDIRLMNKEIIDKIKLLKLKHIHFAYDMMKYQEVIERGLTIFKDKTNFKRDKISVFILTNFNTTIEEDLHRVYFVRDLGFSPYIMIYNKQSLPQKDIHLRMARWVNNRFIFNSTKTFEEYK